jgi:hypothetical protein
LITAMAMEAQRVMAAPEAMEAQRVMAAPEAV